MQQPAIGPNSLMRGPLTSPALPPRPRASTPTGWWAHFAAAGDNTPIISASGAWGCLVSLPPTDCMRLPPRAHLTGRNRRVVEDPLGVIRRRLDSVNEYICSWIRRALPILLLTLQMNARKPELGTRSRAARQKQEERERAEGHRVGAERGDEVGPAAGVPPLWIPLARRRHGTQFRPPLGIHA
jgi:hypothetical protein